MSRFTSSPARGRFARLLTLLALVLAATGILGTSGAAASTASVSLSCFPPTLDSGETTHCLSIVTTPSETPQGGVEFFTTGWGDFGKGFCLFEKVIGHQAFCNLAITGTVGGQQQIFAVYADKEEVEHEASTRLTVKGGTVDVFCTPETLTVLETAECEVFVPSKPGGKAPTGPVQFSADIRGALPFSAGKIDPSCTLEPAAGGGRCLVHFTPEIDGLDAVVARYAGDGSNPANNGSSLLLVRNGHETSTSVKCDSTHPVLQTTMSCAVTVTNLDPTGGAPTGRPFFRIDDGRFEFPTNLGDCDLKPVAEKSSESTCSIEFRPQVLRDQTLEVRYAGDTHGVPRFDGSVATLLIQPIVGHKTATKVVCAPTKVTVPGTCIATVTDLEPNPSRPTGEVRWNPNLDVQLSARGCVLVPATATNASQCSVQYTMSTAGQREFLVAYSGSNALHSPNTGTARVSVTG